MSSLAKFSVERPVAVSMRIAALVVLGAICLTKLPIDLLPKITIPTVGVNTSYANVAPEDMESVVTRPVEEAVSSAPNIYSVQSTSTLGNSSVRIQFQWGTDIGQAAVDVLQLVERARAGFPLDPNLQTPIVYKFDPSQLPIMIFGVTGIDSPTHLRDVLDNQVTPMFESANGVASCVASGGLPRAIVVNVDPAKLQSYGISLSQVESRIVQENIDLPSGIAKLGKTEYTIRALGYFTSPMQGANIPIGFFNGQMIRLGQVATVKDSNLEQRIYTRLNGKPCAGMMVIEQNGANTIATAQAVNEKLKLVKKLYPQLHFDLAYEQAGFISASIDDLKNTALIGGLLAVLILMAFLRNFRATMVVALSIPISIVSTFSLLYFGGFTLNTISLSGMALSTGLIVDDAVVVLENIFRHIERDNRRAAEAAVTGAQEIMGAVVASTITVMVVFFPLLLVKGQSGQMFSQFALVVIFSIAVSLLDATTVVPMLASRLIREEEVLEEAHPERRELHGRKLGPVTRFFDWSGKKFNGLDESYHRGLRWAIHHRILVLIAAMAVTGASLLLVPMVGTEMLPQTDSGNFSVGMKYPVGTALEVTNAGMKRIEKYLMSLPDVAVVFSAAGSSLSLRGSTTAQIGYQGSCTVQLKEKRKSNTQDLIIKVQKEVGAMMPGARIVVTPYDLVTQILTGGATNEEVDIFGQNMDQVQIQAKKAIQELRGVPGLESVDQTAQESTPELRWKVDRDKAMALGVNFSDIANALNTSTSGTICTYYHENGFQYPIYVQMPMATRKSIDQLLRLPITPSMSPQMSDSSTSGGGSGSSSVKVTPAVSGFASASSGSSGGSSAASKQVLLGQVATPETKLGPNEIDRLDRQRFIAITGRVQGRSESEVQADITRVMNKLSESFPTGQGMYWDYGINQRRKADEFSGLGLSVVLAITLIYMLLASQFESFVFPLVVLCSVPLCASGVVLGLFLSNRAFGLTAFIGLLMLIGIVVKNGILLVDYTNQLRGRGMPRDEAILTASPTRLRPILMTSSAAVLGMLPLALGIGKGSETQAPLATAVVGGLTTSTMLTLFIVPVVYTLFDDLAKMLRKNSRDLAAAQAVGPSLEAFEKKPDPLDPPTAKEKEPLG
ncbi:MAG: efflux RND transporter permease subunit [Fimbriimonas sp.]|nr:efflux RND transporter permease subunit [Fimbriimonas sp.]